ncbi:protein rolling stone-like [Anticarsia gemmatalis]|uniref:protein rolling stone-like n=1 Tax=Anticarsia gemmatalis TaxID=129554 RepID=UPI003F766AD6
MVRWSWKQGLNCITGIFDKDENVLCEPFTRSCIGRISPLYWRIPILVWALVIMIWSVSFFWGPTEMFFLYMTHWGLGFIVLESTFGIYVASQRKGLTDATFGLPWYVKAYWLLYNITIPVAFLITVFYWGVLKSAKAKVNYAPDPVLDVMLHGVNSCVMLVELVCSAHPSRLMHIMQPLWFAGAYMLFTVIYYFAGGQDPWGNSFIYPVVDWSKPEQTLVVITLTALFLALMHLIVVGIASARDAIAKRRLAEPAGVYNDAFSP